MRLQHQHGATTVSTTIATAAATGKATQEIWGQMRDYSWEGIQEMYEKGEISKEQINYFIDVKNLSDDEWSQIKKDYLEGTINKEEFEQIKQIREMPGDWTTLENGIKGISYGVGIGLWEGLQWYVGGKLGNLTTGSSKVIDSAIRVEADTLFNALDTPLRTILDSFATGNTLEESWNAKGGVQTMLTDIGIGLIGSIGGEILDAVNKVKIDEVTINERLDIAKKQMSEYFSNNPKLNISEERLNTAFNKIIPCSNDEAFVNIAHQITDWSDDEIRHVNAFRSNYNGGTIVLRPDNSAETIIHEVNHDLGSLDSIEFDKMTRRINI